MPPQKMPVGSQFVLSQIDTLLSKKNWNKGGQRHHDAYYVAAVVGEKACLGNNMKTFFGLPNQCCQTVV